MRFSQILIGLVLLSLASRSRAEDEPLPPPPCARPFTELTRRIKYFAGKKKAHSALYSTVRELNQQLKMPLLTSQEKIEIQNVFLNESSNGISGTKNAFQIVMDARLKKLPPAVAKDVREYMETRIVHKKGSFDGLEDPALNQVVITLPDELRGTVAEYLLLIHELEHAIKSRYLRKIRNYTKPSAKIPAYRFRNEKGSLYAEWQFLSAIPKLTRIKIQSELKEMQNLDGATRKFLIRVLDQVDQDPFSYVRDEWRSGRNDKETFHRSKLTQGFDKMVMPMIEATSAGIILSLTCAWLRPDFDEPKSLFYEKICEPIQF